MQNIIYKCNKHAYDEFMLIDIHSPMREKQQIFHWMYRSLVIKNYFSLALDIFYNCVLLYMIACQLMFKLLYYKLL